MQQRRVPGSVHAVSLIALVWLALMNAGCAGLTKKAVPAPAGGAAGSSGGQPDACSALREDIERLKAERAASAGDRQVLDDRVAALQLRLLEKDAAVRSLKGQLSTQQAEFDRAISEVVRSKAKLRSLESKAEAASDMAEVELALRAVKARYASGEAPAVVAQAEQLLGMSGQEFKQQNFGGALYLTTQAQRRIRIAEVQASLRGNLEPVSDEIRFASPIELTVIKPSNIRKAPSLEADILATLQPGTPLVGYSYKGKWVRVATADHAAGWVFQNLLGGLE